MTYTELSAQITKTLRLHKKALRKIHDSAFPADTPESGKMDAATLRCNLILRIVDKFNLEKENAKANPT